MIAPLTGALRRPSSSLCSSSWITTRRTCRRPTRSPTPPRTCSRRSTLTAGAAYAIFFITANYDARPGGSEVSPFYIFDPNQTNLVPFIFRVAEGVWRSVIGSVVTSMGKITLTSKEGMMAAAYGAIVAGLLLYGSRNRQHNAEPASTNTIIDRGLFPASIALAAGLLPMVAMDRIPWNPGDAIQSRYELPLLPITASLIVCISLSLVRQRFWAVPILLLGFIAGNATFVEVWSAISERQQMSALGVVLEPSFMPGFTLSVSTPSERISTAGPDKVRRDGQRSPSAPLTASLTSAAASRLGV